MTEKDRGAVHSNDTADVQTYTQADVDALLAQRDADAQSRANLPAYEEGPHLKDKAIRAAKRKQMIDAGVSDDDENLTGDMKAILREKN